MQVRPIFFYSEVPLAGFEPTAFTLGRRTAARARASKVLVRGQVINPRIRQCTHGCTHTNDPLPALPLVAISAPRCGARHRRWSIHRQLKRSCLDRLLFSGLTVQLVLREKAFNFTNSGSTGNQLHHGRRNDIKPLMIAATPMNLTRPVARQMFGRGS
jgi:hypothetical protein